VVEKLIHGETFERLITVNSSLTNCLNSLATSPRA
jgi:hypothetical protein